MIAYDTLKFNLNVLKFLGYRWDTEDLKPMQIAYCIILLFARKGFDFFCFLQTLHKPEFVIRSVIILITLSKIVFFMILLSTIVSVFLSLTHRRQLRRLLFERIHDWEKKLILHQALITEHFEFAKRLLNFTSFFLIILNISYTIYYHRKKQDWSVSAFFVILSDTFSRLLYFLQSKLYSEVIFVVILQLKVTNQLAKEHKLKLNEVKRMLASLLLNVKMINKCFGYAILLEIPKNFILLVGYGFLFSQILVTPYLRQRPESTKAFFDTIPLMLTFVLIFISATILVNEVCWKKITFSSI